MAKKPMCLPVCAMGSSRRATDVLARRWRGLLAWVVALGALAPWLVACGASEAGRPPLKVVATIAPLADWARQVGQAHVAVRQLVPAGVDPTTYTPSSADRRALSEADVLLFNGLELEPWLDAALLEARPQQMISLELAQFVGPRARGQRPSSRQLEPDNDSLNMDRSGSSAIIAQPAYSPYLWLDPSADMAQRSVMLIADTFARADSDRLIVYRRHAEQYNGELENLDSWIKRQARTWPRVRVGSRQQVVWQSADRSWHYFAERYGVNLRTVSNLRSVDPPLPESTPLFVDRFRVMGDQLRGAASRPPDVVLDPLGEESYIQLMRRNVNLMTEGLSRASRNASATRDRLPEAP